MGHRPRADRQEGWHHVVNRGVDHQTTFVADVDRIEFGRLLGVGHERFGVEVHAYCLMTNHFHLVLHCPDGGLSDFMQVVTSVFTRHVNERVGRDGPLFRGRFASREIRTDEYLRNAVRYVHRNPLAIDPTVPLETYRWSSHRTYLGHRREPAWLRTDVVLAGFADRRAFSEFVVRPDELRPPSDVAALLSATHVVAEEIASDAGRARQGLERTILLLALEASPDVGSEAMLEAVGLAPGRRQHEAIWRARRLARMNPALAVAAERVLGLAA
ncbi:MAG: hypothetical protein HKN41_02905 [Ilumatobacter sp.]|nr:hypothetical protein [Ilumatobacter sp.]